MYKQVSKLIVYRDLGADSILRRLADIFEDFDWYKENVLGNSSAFSASKLEEMKDKKHISKESLITRIYGEIKRLLDLATDYGFDDNLWHNYLTFLLITNENSFTLTSEKVGANEGSVNHFAKNDFRIFKALFDYNFYEIERELGIDCFSTISDYRAIVKKERMYNYNVSSKVRELSKRLENCDDEEGFFWEVTRFYADYGVGMFGLNKAFRIRNVGDRVDIFPINNTENVVLDDLVGYEMQKKKLIDNTEAFVEGRPANNCLLFGDSGTGKSTCIKAVINEYYDRGLRMIEIYKHQFKDLSTVISMVKNRNYRFIIYMDDLSFEEFEIEYKFLKAVIEGGVETKPDNVLIYATSNRRHLIKETWNDRNDLEHGDGGELHRSDTMQEKLSLVNRFGVTISFSRPNQKEYFYIVTELAKKEPAITLSEAELCAEANKWELSHGGISGRTAQQFINYLAGKK
ncbi:MAG: ATP-binding protein [Bacteroidales bacterium]|nr:ATP-binding protein [Clostridium sp.]MCM1203555.1 ATP-binding protein [Bacteroidales bacterium]